MPKESEQSVKVPDLVLLAATEKALGVTTNADPEVIAHPRQYSPEAWIARSQIEETDLAKPGDKGFIVMPRWLANKNEFYYEEA